MDRNKRILELEIMYDNGLLTKVEYITLCKHYEKIDLYESKIEKQNKCKHENIEYCSTYEQRSSDMYCKDCGKYGSREELQGGKNEYKKVYTKTIPSSTNFSL